MPPLVKFLAPEGQDTGAGVGAVDQLQVSGQDNAQLFLNDEVPKDQSVMVDLDVARRIVLDPEDDTLVRVIRSPTGEGGLMNRLGKLRGFRLMTACGIELSKEDTFETILEAVERSDEYLDGEQIELVFHEAPWPPNRAEKKRQERNNLYPPEDIMMELTKDVILAHLQVRPGRFQSGTPVIRDISKVPNKMNFYFNHKKWNLHDISGLMQLPQRSLNELDLSHCQLRSVGAELSRFEQLTELRLNDNHLPSIELHYLPRLKGLYLAFNNLTVLPELMGLPALQVLDLSDNQIGSRESSNELTADKGESADGWELLVHSPLHDLRTLLLPNNQLKWQQAAFNSRVSVLADNKALTELDFRGNPMMFSPRLDDLPPLRRTRPWILAQCPKLLTLDGDAISEQERLRMLLDPIAGEPEAEDEKEDEEEETGGGENMMRYPYVGPPRLSALPVHAEMLAATFSLPANMVMDVLQHVQASLQLLFSAPPQARFFFEPQIGFETLLSQLKGGSTGAAAAQGPAQPTGDAVFAGMEEDDDEGPQNRHRLSRRKSNIENESRIAKGTGLLTEEQVLEEEERYEREFLEEQLNDRGEAMGNDPALVAVKASDNTAIVPADEAVVEAKEATSAAEMFAGLTNKFAKRNRELSDPQAIIDDVVQQIILIFERSPQADILSSLRTERAFALETANAHKRAQEAAAERALTHGSLAAQQYAQDAAAKIPPPTTSRNERLTIAQRALRLLTTCAALGGDGSWGQVLAHKALEALLGLLASTEDKQELIINEALAVLVPPVQSDKCHDWIQWSHLGLMEKLVTVSPLVGLELISLCPTLRHIATTEKGTAPLTLFQLLGKLAKYEDVFPRSKAKSSNANLVLNGRSDALESNSPATELHEAGMTRDLVNWITVPSGEQERIIDKWTGAKQLCVWEVVEGLARHVRAASSILVENDIHMEVRKALQELLKDGLKDSKFKREKTEMVSQYVLTCEALSRHAAKARTVLYALPSGFGQVLGDDFHGEFTGYADDFSVLKHILEMLPREPQQNDERCDAILVTACLQLLGSLVFTANGAMLAAISKILGGVYPVLTLALPKSNTHPEGRLDKIVNRAAEWALIDRKHEGLELSTEELKILAALDHGDRSAFSGQADVTTVDNPSVRAMLRALVRMMVAYAQRADQYTRSIEDYKKGKGPAPDESLEVALAVTNKFDEKGRDQIIFAMLRNNDDELRIQAMECLATVPTANLERDEIQEIVFFVHEKVRTHQVYVGQNELMMKHAFDCFARLSKEPDGDAKSAGTVFRRENADMVQLALQLLEDNSTREIPESSTMERLQKTELSVALTNFLQACSGPARGQEHDPDATAIWPQAVSVLRMQDSTQMMVQVMHNEEQFGDGHTSLKLENSALADTVDRLLATLSKVAPTSDVKTRLLHRLATLLEGELGHEDNEKGGSGDVLDVEDVSKETDVSRRRRVQQHVSFLRRNGVDLVLTQLENELAELRATQRISTNEPSSLDDDANANVGQDEVLPADANREAVQAKVDGVHEFVKREEEREELMMTMADDGGDAEGADEELRRVANEMRDWNDRVHIYALYSEELHMMEHDLSPGPKGELGFTQRALDANGLGDDGHLDPNADKWKHAEETVSATLRVLTACVRYGSAETVGALLERLQQESMQNDILNIAGYAGVFTSHQQSESALRFVRLWNEVLHGMAIRNMLTIDMLPLLDTLARLLPRLLEPWASHMESMLDRWKRASAQDGAEAANAQMLQQQHTQGAAGGMGRMLQFLPHLAGLYSMMLSALSFFQFSKQDTLDTAAKELALRRLLPKVAPGPLSGSVQSAAGGADKPPQSALVAFLSALFFDAVLRLAEGWNGDNNYAVGKGGKAGDDARHHAIDAIKGLLASFCVLDEERRFELFQHAARLEARWKITLPPALMFSITQRTELQLYRRALEPYLVTTHLIDDDGERLLDLSWMVQELPARRPTVLLIVTNRAVYLLQTRKQGVCNVCEPWKLCPEGPQLVRTIPLYRIQSITVDFTAKYGAGHRLQLECMREAGEAKGTGINPVGWACAPCTTERQPPSAEKADPWIPNCFSSRDASKPADGSGGDGDKAIIAKAKANKSKPFIFQFSTLYVGVVQRIASAIKRQHPHVNPPLKIHSDRCQPRVLLQLHEQEKHAGGKFPLTRTDLAAPSPANHLEDIDFVKLAVRCERRGKEAKKSNNNERLMVLTHDAIKVYTERPELFALPPAEELDASMRDHARGDGMDVMKKEFEIKLVDLSLLQLELSAEPRVKLRGAEEKTHNLQFADDTAALLFRSKMREALWNKGRARWSGVSLEKPE